MLRNLRDLLAEQAPDLLARTKLSRKDHRHGNAQCACQQVITGFGANSAGLRSVARSVGTGAEDTADKEGGNQRRCGMGRWGRALDVL